MWGLNTQPVENSSSLDKLSSENDEVYDPLYHPGRPIESTTEVDGLRQLFSPGQNQMANALFSNPFTAAASSSSSMSIGGHQRPADDNPSSSLISYPVTGSTALIGTTERNETMMDQYNLLSSSVNSGTASNHGAGLLPCSSADQMMRSYHCRLCKQEFENKSDMQNHSNELHRTEEKSHKCIHCLKSFPTSQQLGQHSLVHSNLRKYPCAYCEKSFKQLSHVQQHQRIHTGERPYKCIVDGCTKAFRQLSSLQQHLKGHNLPVTKSFSHPQSPLSPGSGLVHGSKFKKTALPRPHDLTCQVCEERCADDELFFQHIHKHHPDFWRVLSGGLPLSDFVEPSSEMRLTKAKKFTCPICSKRYAHETGYAKHLASHPTPFSHTGGSGQLFNCAVCRKMFTKEVHLYRHLEMKTDLAHSASFNEMRKKNAHGLLGNSTGDVCSSVDPDSSSKSFRPSFRVQNYPPMMRSNSLDQNGLGTCDATESFLQSTSRKYKYGRDSEAAVASSAPNHLGAASCLSPRNCNSGSSTPDAFSYVRSFSGTASAFGDVYRKDCDAAFRGYPFPFGGHLNQDFGHARNPYAQNFFCQRSNVDSDRRHSPPDSRHPYFPSSYMPHTQGVQGPLHGVISQPSFVHSSVDTARFDSTGGLLDPYLQRSGFSDHEMATALHQLARSIPGFI